MNNEDMSELFSKFSNMVNEGNIPDEMKNILSSLSNNTGEENREKKTEDKDSLGVDFETIMKMKTIMEKMKGNGDDPRAKLLLSLKPYLKDSRKDKIDQYIKLFGMSKVMEIFGDVRRWNEKIMEMFPFFRRPYYYYARNNYMNSTYNLENPDKAQKQGQNYINSSYKKNNEEENKKRGQTEKKGKIELQGEAPIFEIFGIKLYFDDILLIALIFFLYNEGVEDNLLFISLILLLLS